MQRRRQACSAALASSSHPANSEHLYNRCSLSQNTRQHGEHGSSLTVLARSMGSVHPSPPRGWRERGMCCLARPPIGTGQPRVCASCPVTRLTPLRLPHPSLCLSQASGVGVADEVIEAFDEIKMKRQHKFVMFKISDDLSEIVIDHKSNDADYSTFLGLLPAVRFLIFGSHSGAKDPAVIPLILPLPLLTGSTLSFPAECLIQAASCWVTAICRPRCAHFC